MNDAEPDHTGQLVVPIDALTAQSFLLHALSCVSPLRPCWCSCPQLDFLYA